MTQLPSVSELISSSGLPSQPKPPSTSSSAVSPKESKSPVSPYFLPKILSQPSLTTYSSDSKHKPSTQAPAGDYFQSQQQQPLKQQAPPQQQFVPSYTTANHRGSIVTTPGSTMPLAAPPPLPHQQGPQPGPPQQQTITTYTHYSHPVSSPYTSAFPQYYYYQPSITPPQHQHQQQQQQQQPPPPIPHGEPYYHPHAPQGMVAPPPPPPPQQQPLPQGYYYVSPQHQPMVANSQQPPMMANGPVPPPRPMYDENNALINKRRIIKRRTRTGCLTCRKRRIKCDERKPSCFNCERSKKVCLGYQDLLNLQPRKRNRDTSLDLPKEQPPHSHHHHAHEQHPTANGYDNRRPYEMVPAGYQGVNHSSGILPPPINTCYAPNAASRVAVSDLLK
ncbi:White-opaque regulator 1 [Candida viswanathii]|uniref:White-opaque regulator 1 n=1 Tax=Candida viswanathii TaxID=5486 RepID=A0A367YEU8_9ASCO|nr:White-opaque regulator 1 [Candida viswanathii]